VNQRAPILFACPYCHTALSVPAEFSGVTAPCPQCALPITAPVASSPAVSNPYEHTVPISPHQPTSGYFDAPKTTDPIRPEPRGVAPRQHPDLAEKILAKPAPVHGDEPEPQIKNRSHSKSSGSRSFLRLIIPCILLAALAFGFIKLAHFLKQNSLTQPQGKPPEKQLKSVWDAQNKKNTNTNSQPSVATPPTDVKQQPPVAINPAPLAPSTLTPLASPPDEVKPETNPEPEELPSGALAFKTVEQFLAAKSLEERVIYVQTRLSPEELPDTILAYNWPTAIVTPGSQIPHPQERLTEFYYEARFGENSQKFPRVATILVHQRGSEPPKVLLDPLLDTIGGRLSAFVKKPTAGTLDFYTIMEAHPHCFMPEIPNSDKKSTFHLRAHINGEIIASTYANEKSSVLDEFADSLTGLKWRNPSPVVVTLQWNTSESPTRPFIELIAIKSKDWRN
jgi:hypothetical protein